ncbi:MAG: cytochrome c oxidase subunit II [Acidobacteriaceae bacterium]|nr:cytochrome c oxidase subunit II [Acidobacteriaceae bacterium]
MPVKLLAQISLYPPTASAQARGIDELYWFITIVSAVMTLLIFACIILFAWKYNRRKNPHATQIEGSTKLELTWSILPFFVMLVMFFWGAKLFFAASEPPKDAMEVFVTGKQWMWKVQYPDGGREIDELHVPVGQPVKLTMASEDVIHSFSIPAFRVRHDVIPGHYDTVWFTATKPGRYHLFCTEYCGNQHANMIGWVEVMDPRAYANWASGGGTQGTLAEQGQALFQQFGCATCHLLDQQGRCPILRGLYNKPVQLNDGTTVIANDAYLRESILDPNAKIVAGFEPNVMPNFKGQVTEENVIQLIAFIKSLSPQAPASQQGEQQRPIVIAPRAPGAASTSNSRNSKVPANSQPQ